MFLSHFEITGNRSITTRFQRKHSLAHYYDKSFKLRLTSELEVALTAVEEGAGEEEEEGVEGAVGHPHGQKGGEREERSQETVLHQGVHGHHFRVQRNQSTQQTVCGRSEIIYLHL